MDADALVEQLLANTQTLELLSEPLPDDAAAALVERLKAEADRHWWVNANRSLELADTIVRIGAARHDTGQIALGIMARGDALKLLGRVPEAWNTLDEAGSLFRSVGDEIGWARTRIGRLPICVDLNQVATALAEGAQAREIFERYAVHDKQLVLDLNTAAVYTYLGDHRQGLQLFQQALATARRLGSAGEGWLVPLLTNIGFAHEALGDFRAALRHHEQASAIAAERHESRSLAVVETNIAIVHIKQGQYRRALQLLHRAHDLYEAETLARDAADVQRIIVECYLLLNRYAEARDLARSVAADFHEFGAGYEEALTLLDLAVAEAELGDLAAAEATLNTAQPIFAALDAPAWLATTRLRRGQVALQHGNVSGAREEASAAITGFDAMGQQVKRADALLLYGRALLAEQRHREAGEVGRTALEIARQCNVPPLRYAAHLLLGRIAEAHADLRHAARRYRAAAAVVERVQRGLTITLRPGFLEDKGEALQALIGLHLRRGEGRPAFEALERAKSQVLLSYLSNREHVRWPLDNTRARALARELDQLREEHRWFYELAHEQLHHDESRTGAVAPEQALAEVAKRERRMRAITEQLYLESGDQHTPRRAMPPTLEAVQHSLADETLLLEFYNNGRQLWCFAIRRDRLEVRQLAATVADVDKLLMQWQMHVAAALKAGPATATARGFTKLAERILQRLYAALIAPLEDMLAAVQRVVVVPYGALHYLPFHLLHGGGAYLGETHELVTLPTAGLALQRGPRRSGGACVLAHSWNGRLPHALAEARMVQQTLGGQGWFDAEARRNTLRAEPSRVLHIAAHGEHRLDNPDLSYIQLADGQLYTDDLLQLDLSYELVTLSACETGRANVTAGDELIGLGRGFLYAGAGALIVSLWPVVDEHAVALMEHLYKDLSRGASKAAALRAAQQRVRQSDPGLHPAFWGAFQLIGDHRPLSPAMPSPTME